MAIIRGKYYKDRRKKGGERLMELAKESRRKAKERKERRVGGRKYVTPLSKSRKASTGPTVIRHGKTKITVNGKPSPHLKPKAKRKIHTVRMYTAEDKRKYKEQYKKTARKPDPALKRPLTFSKTKAKPAPKPAAKTTKRPLGTIKASSPKSAGTMFLDYLAPKHRGIGQSDTGYSRAGAGDVGLEVGKKALNAWLTASGGKAVWGGAKQLKNAPGLAKKMKPWLTGKKPVMSKEFIKTLGGKNLDNFVKFARKQGRRVQERLGLKPIPKPRRITHKPDFIKPTGSARPMPTTAKPKPKPAKEGPPKWQRAADKPITKPPTGKPTKRPAKKSAKKPAKKAPVKKPAVKKPAKKVAKKKTTPKQAMQSLIDEVTGLRVGKGKPRIVSKKKPAAKKPAAKSKKKVLRPSFGRKQNFEEGGKSIDDSLKELQRLVDDWPKHFPTAPRIRVLKDVAKKPVKKSAKKKAPRKKK